MMYEYISGTITKITPKYIVIDTRGIGYQIFTPNPYEFKKDEILLVYTYYHVREDEASLYGFKTEEARDMFIKLISVNGIGPKTALAILSASSNIDEIKLAIEKGDAKYIQKFPGIGPKSAQQIILDLRGKIEFNEQISLISDTKIDECIEALVALGYNKKDVSKAVGKVDQSLDQSSIIKQALKVLSKA